ncbi:MAG: hypothetical protein Q8N04_06850 [Nitrospira sp.]|nr:hypothetical protein [Nitrospira sp.]
MLISSQYQRSLVQLARKIGYRPCAEIDLVLFALATKQGAVRFANYDIIYQIGCRIYFKPLKFGIGQDCQCPVEGDQRLIDIATVGAYSRDAHLVAHLRFALKEKRLFSPASSRSSIMHSPPSAPA